MIPINEPRPTRARLALAALCVALVGVIYLETGWSGADMRAPVAPERDQVAPPVQGDDATFAMPPLDSLAEVVRRPLFSEQRRPPATAAVAAADVRSTGFILVGIVMSPTGGLALIEHGQPQHLDRVHEHQELDGWTVEQIVRDHVTLRHADDRIQIKVTDGPPGTPSAGVALPPPVGNVTNVPPHFVGTSLPPPNSNMPGHFVGTSLPPPRKEE